MRILKSSLRRRISKIQRIDINIERTGQEIKQLGAATDDAIQM
jgi:hypothetical protein